MIQVAPINAEDYGSGDLDKHFNRMSSLRIDTGKGPTMASRALEALGIADDDILKDAEEDGKEDLFEVCRVQTLSLQLCSAVQGSQHHHMVVVTKCRLTRPPCCWLSPVHMPQRPRG